MSNNTFGYQKSQNTKYKDPAVVRDKWIRINRNINKYTDASTMLQNIREAFILVECVMYNTLQDYKEKYISVGVEVPGERNTYTFHYPERDITINFSDKSPFSMSRILVQLGYKLPKELDDTRKIRNFISHNLETTTVEYFTENMNYDIAKRAMKNLGQTLVALNMLLTEDIVPSFECMRVKEGETVGLSHEFTVERFIAKSGTSRLYEGLHNRLNVRVAIKELLPKTYSESLLMQEKDLLVSLGHPQIPRVYDVFNQNGTFYIVMDYIDGVGLDKYIANNRLSMEQKLGIMIEVCNVVNYLHDKKQMVHTDLKPQNIMIDSDGIIHIIDFGTAMNKHQNPDIRSVSSGYTAPEVIEGKKIDYRIDLYSLGAILKFMFRDELENISDNDNEKLHSINRIISRCMEHDPYARYNNVVEIQYEIKQIISGGTDNIKKHIRPKRKGNTLNTIFYIVLLLAIIVSVGIKVLNYVNNNKDKDEATEQTATEEKVTTTDITETNDISDDDALDAFAELEEKAWNCYITGDEEGFMDLWVYDEDQEQQLHDLFRTASFDARDIYPIVNYLLMYNDKGMCYGCVVRAKVKDGSEDIRPIYSRDFAYMFSYSGGKWKFDATEELTSIIFDEVRYNIYCALGDNFMDAISEERNYELLCGADFTWMNSNLVYEGTQDADVVAVSQLEDGSIEFVVTVKNGLNKKCIKDSCRLSLKSNDGKYIVQNYYTDEAFTVEPMTSELITFIVPKKFVKNLDVEWNEMMEADVIME